MAQRRRPGAALDWPALLVSAGRRAPIQPPPPRSAAACVTSPNQSGAPRWPPRRIEGSIGACLTSGPSGRRRRRRRRRRRPGPDGRAGRLCGLRELRRRSRLHRRRLRPCCRVPAVVAGPRRSPVLSGPRWSSQWGILCLCAVSLLVGTHIWDSERNKILISGAGLSENE